MSDDEKVPEEWRATVDRPPVSNWLADVRCPMGDDHSKEDVLQFLKQKKDPELQHFVVETDDELPQSFAHWWLYMRDAWRTALAADEGTDDIYPNYPTLEKWLSVVEDWKTPDEVTHADIFGTFKAWLDILFLDMAVYANEEQRDGVPRRFGDVVVWEAREGVGTRKETMDFVIREGLNIMQERGWTDGYEYWKNECKKYLVFS